MILQRFLCRKVGKVAIRLRGFSVQIGCGHTVFKRLGTILLFLLLQQGCFPVFLVGSLQVHERDIFLIHWQAVIPRFPASCCLASMDVSREMQMHATRFINSKSGASTSKYVEQSKVEMEADGISMTGAGA